jgi:hypothetical protein
MNSSCQVRPWQQVTEADHGDVWFLCRLSSTFGFPLAKNTSNMVFIYNNETLTMVHFTTVV